MPTCRDFGDSEPTKALHQFASGAFQSGATDIGGHRLVGGRERALRGAGRDGLAGVALLVGGVDVANTMVISVLERKREIGLRRALGNTRGQIRTQFFTESVVLCLLGGLTGSALGVLGTATYAASRDWPATIPPAVVLGGVSSALAIGVLAAEPPPDATTDVFVSMPPLPFEYEGREVVAQFFERLFGADRRFDLVPTRANGQPAFGAYLRSSSGVSHGTGVYVITLAGERISAMTRFENSVFPSFGLPRSLGPSR
ncbi:FtsX-like permease family protein [Actinophytocola oryzae]|uniref:FtsX-like permease family protein n=1 Tax=Actinophytocola oryzae TaxID=502181 RepID=A0A4R7VWS4_9PSEU|nr:FtsX-like permease family protein [Actinophytocola oryzae]